MPVNASTVVRLYLNGNLYNTYPMQTYLGGKQSAAKGTGTTAGAALTATDKSAKQASPLQPAKAESDMQPMPKQAPDMEKPETPKSTPEDKTLKDLDL